MRIKRFEHPLLPPGRLATNGPAVFMVTKNPLKPNNAFVALSSPFEHSISSTPEEEKVIAESLLPGESLIPTEELLPE